jgi:hypothetical protein
MVVNELVDNAFDAHATRVELTFYDPSGLRVRDNGTGIQDIEKALTYGFSRGENSLHQRLGRFGIALKKGPARLGQLLGITSINHKQKIKLLFNWSELEYSGEWLLNPAIQQGSFKDTFTDINIRRMYKNRCRGWRDLPEKLQRTFAPALQSGREIIWLPGSPWERSLPYAPTTGLEDKIETDAQIGNVRLHLLAGIMPEGKKANQGFSLAYGHRVIVGSWTPKFLSGCTTTRFHAEVTLIDGDGEDANWILNNFKDDIEDWQKERLEMKLEELVEPLIAKLKDQGLELRIRSIECFFENMLNGGVKGTYEEHKSGIIDDEWEHGEGKRTRGKKRRARDGSATMDLSGKKKPANPEVSFLIKYEHDDTENLWRIQHDDKSGLIVFWINLNHPLGPQLKEAENQRQLICIVTMALVSFLTTRADYQIRFPFLLNGTSDAHEAMNQNVSRWLRHAIIG